MAKKTKKNKELDNYQKGLMQKAKGTMALGAISTIGAYGFSRLGSSHPATAPTANAAVSGLQLLNVGNIANIGMNLIPKQKKNKKDNKYL